MATAFIIVSRLIGAFLVFCGASGLLIMAVGVPLALANGSKLPVVGVLFGLSVYAILIPIGLKLAFVSASSFPSTGSELGWWLVWVCRRLLGWYICCMGFILLVGGVMATAEGGRVAGVFAGVICGFLAFVTGIAVAHLNNRWRTT